MIVNSRECKYSVYAICATCSCGNNSYRHTLFLLIIFSLYLLSYSRSAGNWLTLVRTFFPQFVIRSLGTFFTWTFLIGLLLSYCFSVSHCAVFWFGVSCTKEWLGFSQKQNVLHILKIHSVIEVLLCFSFLTTRYSKTELLATDVAGCPELDWIGKAELKLDGLLDGIPCCQA